MVIYFSPIQCSECSILRLEKQKRFISRPFLGIPSTIPRRIMTMGPPTRSRHLSADQNHGMLFKWNRENTAPLIYWTLLSCSLMKLLGYLIAFCSLSVTNAQCTPVYNSDFLGEREKSQHFHSLFWCWGTMEQLRTNEDVYTYCAHNCIVFVESHCFLAGISLWNLCCSL